MVEFLLFGPVFTTDRTFEGLPALLGFLSGASARGLAYPGRISRWFGLFPRIFGLK